MRTYQDKLIEKIEETVAKYNSHIIQSRFQLETVVRYNAANVGVIYAQPVNDFTTVLRIHFDIQLSNAKLTLEAPTTATLAKTIDFADGQGWDEVERWILRVCEIYSKKIGRRNG